MIGKKNYKFVRNFIGLIVLISILINVVPITSEASWVDDHVIALNSLTNILNLYNNDPLNHAIVSNSVVYDENTVNEVKGMVDGSFKMWGLANLKVPSQAIINTVKVIPFTYSLYYDDMNADYAIIINYLYTYSGLSLEDFADFKYFVIIDYSGMNGFGGYKRDVLIGLVGTNYYWFDSSTSTYPIFTYLETPIFWFSDQPQTTIIY